MSKNTVPRHAMLSEYEMQKLMAFFNNHHDILLCTATDNGQPNVALMGTPRLNADGKIEFEISDAVSLSLKNMRENKYLVFIAYVPGDRARDYCGVRIYAQVTAIYDEGAKFESIRQNIFTRHGPHKAAELQATISCVMTNVRPVVDRGQRWYEQPSLD